MNFNIYIDDQLGNELSIYAQKLGVTRNKVIREALTSYMANTSKQWPDEVAKFKGLKDFPAFEESRHELKANNEDPFA
jgi:predicted transcriptional regulator